MSTWIHRLKKRNNWALWVNSLINNDDGDDSYRNNHDNIINRIIIADCKKCHRSCLFCRSLHSIALVISRFPTTWGHQRAPRHFISDTRAAYGGALCVVTPQRRCSACGIHHRALHGGVQKKKRLAYPPPTTMAPPLPNFISPLPSSPTRREVTS